MASEPAIGALKEALANTYVLYLKTQNFHWNLQGPHFFSYHQAFEAQYQELSEVVDEIAEVLRAQDVAAPASFSEFEQLSSLASAEGSLMDAGAMAELLLIDHEAMLETIKKRIAALDETQDAQIIDFLTARWQSHEKTAWMLRSSLR